MKKHTRILALLLALCMALSLAACSGNSGSSGSSSASGKTVHVRKSALMAWPIDGLRCRSSGSPSERSAWR